MMLRTEMECEPDHAPPKWVPCVIDLTDLEAARMSANDEAASVVRFRSGEEWKMRMTFDDIATLLNS